MTKVPQIPALIWLAKYQQSKPVILPPVKDVTLKIDAHVPDTNKARDLLESLAKAKAAWSRDLETMQYHKFLQTRYWALIRQAKLIECDSKCEVCSAGESLQIHHTSYKLRGREHKNLRYLNVLCASCHAKRHGK
jgi:uncharacterized Fe-S cluster-containing radical SAM superfamily protein